MEQPWISRRIRALRHEGKSQAGLARHLGLDPPRITEIIKGQRQVKTSEVRGLAHYLDLSEELVMANLRGQDFHLESDDVLAPPARASDHAPAFAGAIVAGIQEVGGVEYVSIPRYDAALSAGHGCINDPGAEPIGYQLIERQWLAAVTRSVPSFLAVVRVDGDSMERTLSDGDWVLIDRMQTTLNREGIYAIMVRGATWIKRISIDIAGRRIRVISDNRDYPVQDLAEGAIQPIGRALMVVARKL